MLSRFQAHFQGRRGDLQPHHHRSGRGKLKIQLPDGVRPIPEYFQQAGYYTSITGWPHRERDHRGKTDYNFEWHASMYDGPDWSQREKGQPFFAQIQLRGGKHRGGTTEGTQAFLERIRSQMAPGGQGVFSFPKRWNLRAPTRWLRLNLNGCPVHFYGRSQVRDLVDRAGWPEADIHTLSRDYIVHARAASK